MDVANLSFRTFSHATEDPERVERALRFVSGAGVVKRSTTSGYHRNPIIVMEARVTDGKGIKAVFRSLGREELQRLLESLDRRMDEESFFFFRLDKQEAYLGNIKSGEGDDVIAVRAKVKSYPQNRSNALLSMEKFLRSELERFDHLDRKG
jgi:RNA binding exosome subunit